MLQVDPLVAGDVVANEVPAVALGPLAVLGVVVSVAAVDEHQATVHHGAVEVPGAGASHPQLPLSLQVVEGVQLGGELGHAGAEGNVAAVDVDLVGDLVEDCGVAVASFDWVAGGLYNGPLSGGITGCYLSFMGCIRADVQKLSKPQAPLGGPMGNWKPFA